MYPYTSNQKSADDSMSQNNVYDGRPPGLGAPEQIPQHSQSLERSGFQDQAPQGPYQSNARFHQTQVAGYSGEQQPTYASQGSAVSYQREKRSSSHEYAAPPGAGQLEPKTQQAMQSSQSQPYQKVDAVQSSAHQQPQLQPAYPGWTASGYAQSQYQGTVGAAELGQYARQPIQQSGNVQQRPSASASQAPSQHALSMGSTLAPLQQPLQMGDNGRPTQLNHQDFQNQHIKISSSISQGQLNDAELRGQAGQSPLPPQQRLSESQDQNISGYAQEHVQEHHDSAESFQNNSNSFGDQRSRQESEANEAGPASSIQTLNNPQEVPAENNLVGHSSQLATSNQLGYANDPDPSKPPNISEFKDQQRQSAWPVSGGPLNDSDGQVVTGHYDNNFNSQNPSGTYEKSSNQESSNVLESTSDHGRVVNVSSDSIPATAAKGHAVGYSNSTDVPSQGQFARPTVFNVAQTVQDSNAAGPEQLYHQSQIRGYPQQNPTNHVGLTVPPVVQPHQPGPPGQPEQPFYAQISYPYNQMSEQMYQYQQALYAQAAAAAAAPYYYGYQPGYFYPPDDSASQQTAQQAMHTPQHAAQQMGQARPQGHKPACPPLVGWNPYNGQQAFGYYQRPADYYVMGQAPPAPFAMQIPNMMGLATGGPAAQPSSPDMTVTQPAGQLAPPGVQPKVTTTLWEDESTLCYQVEARGVCVARREDNDMINGTKLLNVAGMTRGRRDGLLKNERYRRVVKAGAMHLKGVWIPYERALDFANKEKITDLLYPLFVTDIKSVLYTPNQPINSNRIAEVTETPEFPGQVQDSGERENS